MVRTEFVGLSCLEQCLAQSERSIKIIHLDFRGRVGENGDLLLPGETG